MKQATTGGVSLHAPVHDHLAMSPDDALDGLYDDFQAVQEDGS